MGTTQSWWGATCIEPLGTMGTVRCLNGGARFHQTSLFSSGLRAAISDAHMLVSTAPCMRRCQLLNAESTPFPLPCFRTSLHTPAALAFGKIKLEHNRWGYGETSVLVCDQTVCHMIKSRAE